MCEIWWVFLSMGSGKQENSELIQNGNKFNWLGNGIYICRFVYAPVFFHDMWVLNPFWCGVWNHQILSCYWRCHSGSIVHWLSENKISIQYMAKSMWTPASNEMVWYCSYIITEKSIQSSTQSSNLFKFQTFWGQGP